MEEDFVYDAIVIGAGHAGVEAALALARKKHRVLIFSINLDAVGFLACNPSIGGTAKGHLVCEIDALGGEMGINTDASLIQIRMLNAGKGPAVYSLRAQVDKQRYHNRIKKVLEENENVYLKQGAVKEILSKNNTAIGIITEQGERFMAKTVIVATGVYLKSKIFIGEYTKEVGPNGFSRSENLTDSIMALGHSIIRFKTGTPARLNGRTINFDEMVEQNGEDNIQSFSFLTDKTPENVSRCYLTYTNLNTHEIIKNNIKRAAMFSGEIVGIGPRYCPSIESKITRFSDKDRHQTFLEPEGLYTNEYYVQGVSTSLPADVQKNMYASIKGLENAQIMRDAYAIEYDAINSKELKPTLESKLINNLFFAGQINGTSGYEEAAAQGLIAGLNAALMLEGNEQLVLKRNEAYIGVLIDDLVTKGTNEPYRMMTSRAEYRLFLRQDNADSRLTELGRNLGLVSDERYDKFIKKQEEISRLKKMLNTKIVIGENLVKFFELKEESIPTTSMTFYKMLKRSKINIFDIKEYFNVFDEFNDRVLEYVNTEIKYEGYIEQEKEDIAKSLKQENMKIPENVDFNSLKGLRIEARQKLSEIRPISVGQASRISGVSPADISVLIIYLKNYN